jgi:hypothetical protein
VAQDLDLARDVVEVLGHVLADAYEAGEKRAPRE